MSHPGQDTAQTPGSPAPSLAWLIERARVPDDAKPLIATATDGGALVQALAANGKAVEALQVIAAAPPPREGVWWAWVSARHGSQFAAPDAAAAPAVAAALGAVEQWIANPDDERRRAAPALSPTFAAGVHLLLATAVGFLVRGGSVPPWAALAFLPVLLRLGLGFLTPPQDLRALGRRELWVAASFTLVCVASFWVSA